MSAGCRRGTSSASGQPEADSNNQGKSKSHHQDKQQHVHPPFALVARQAWEKHFAEAFHRMGVATDKTPATAALRRGRLIRWGSLATKRPACRLRPFVASEKCF